VAFRRSGLPSTQALTGPIWVALSDRKKNPTVDVLDRIARTLGVPISDLFKKPRKGSPPPKPLRSGRRAAPDPSRVD
jgi:transcriptional regulator with XRE-family HTH domain